MSALFADAFLSQLPPSRKKSCNIGLAINARTADDYRMSNQVTGIQIPLTYGFHKDIRKMALSFQRKLQKKLKRDSAKYLVLRFISLLKPSLFDSVLFYKYGLYHHPVTAQLAKVMGYVGKQTRDIGITNLTKVSFPQNEKYMITDCLFIPPAVSYTDCVLGIVTTENGMNLSFRFRADKKTEQKNLLWERSVMQLRNIYSFSKSGVEK